MKQTEMHKKSIDWYYFLKGRHRPAYLKITSITTGEGNGNPLQYSCLENPMGRGDWWAAVHGVAKSRTWLSDFTFTFHFHALEKEMATHSSVLAWRIPRMAEPGGLPSMGTHRVGHDWSDLAAAAAVSLPHPREEIDIVVFLVFQHCFLRREKMKIDVIIKGFPGG